MFEAQATTRIVRYKRRILSRCCILYHPSDINPLGELGSCLFSYLNKCFQKMHEVQEVLFIYVESYSCTAKLFPQTLYFVYCLNAASIAADQVLDPMCKNSVMPTCSASTSHYNRRSGDAGTDRASFASSAAFVRER